MSLSEISPDSKNEEMAVQNQINSFIDKSESIVFNAGAGAGKTYALIESLKYIIKKYTDTLSQHNQNIMCITYTNVATNEIKERLGNSDIVKVSTIHERVWELIKGYQKELIKIHIDKIKEELSRLQFDLNKNENIEESKQFSAYRELSETYKLDFINIINNLKSEFYKYYDKPAKDFKISFGSHIKNYSTLLTNVVNFKKIVNVIYKIDNYQECLRNIEIGNNSNFRAVKYDDKFNRDILHRMLISHDTLLEYALKMINSYDLLKRVILDRYPYILIDEYQDTNVRVIKIMKLFEDHAKSINRKLFIGYFGDTAQNIYEDGVGSDLNNVHPGLNVINKQFNRRSHSEIIDVINKIRNDDIKQRSIYDDCTGGSVKFYTGADDDKQKFIDEYKTKWDINTENKLHCLVLLNKFVAEFNGFPDIYKCFSDTSYYKVNYNQLNNELLSNELLKLGEVPNLFYRILQFIDSLNKPKTSISNLIDKNIYSKMTFLKMKELVSIFNSIKGVSLGEYAQDIFDKYINSENLNYKKVINCLINLERYSFQDFTNFLLDRLFLNLGSGKLNDFKLKVTELFEDSLYPNVDIKETEEFKPKMQQFINSEFFSYLDTQEVNEFKVKLYNLLDEQELSGLSSEDKNLFTTKLDRLFEDEIISIKNDDEVKIAKEKLNNLLNISIKQWFLWYEFINNEQKADTIYHTYHGTKGTEYNNVIIIMENDFGRMNKDKFSSFFKNYKIADSLSEEDIIKFNNTKNLLYVSCSRAIKNLRILYLDDVSDFKDGIESIFGKVYNYE